MLGNVIDAPTVLRPFKYEYFEDTQPLLRPFSLQVMQTGIEIDTDKPSLSMVINPQHSQNKRR
jgi:hypothetical protein